MKLTYYRGDVVGPNFGDELNVWLWPKLLDGSFDEDDSELFFGIGTIIADWWPEEPRKIVLGAGSTPEIAPTLDQSWEILAVRGPLTATLLDIDEALAVCDPAILVSDFVDRTATERKHVTLMVHHARSKRGYWRAACKLAGMTYLDPHDDIDVILRTIQESKVVLAESMHAAIVADCLRVPWIPIVMHDHITSFKWQDWCASIGQTYKPVVLKPLMTGSPAVLPTATIKTLPFLNAFRLGRIADKNESYLSDEAVLEARKLKLYEIVDEFKKRTR